MHLDHLIDPELRRALLQNPEALRETLEALHPEDIAEALRELPSDQSLALVHDLPEELGAAVLERLPSETQTALLEALSTEKASALVLAMSPDDRVDALQTLPQDKAQSLLADIKRRAPAVAEEIRQLGIWRSDTAGGLMTTEYVSLSPDTKIWQAMEAVRQASQERQTETIYYLYVCAFGNKLVGVVSLRDLILSDPGQTLDHVMTTHVLQVAPNDDQEHVARDIAKYDLSAMPVVDEQTRMLGVVTVDDVVDVVIEEATEDAQMMGGVLPLEDSYFETGWLSFIWKRAAWLVLLFVAQMLTTTVMEHHQVTLESLVGLVVFIPLIIASGGNAGSQSSSLIIRALAVGEMTPRDWWRVLRKEITVGLALGLLLGIIGCARAALSDHHISMSALAWTVGISVLCVVVMGTLVGSLLPLAIRRVGLDPAVSSTPFIASIVDVLGLALYFAIAQVVHHVLDYP